MDFKMMSLIQMKILIRLWETPDKMGFAEGRNEGGSVKELKKAGYVIPAGKVRRKIRWRLTEEKISKEDIDSMRKLLGQENFDYELVKWTDGFQIVPGSLNLVCAYIVKRDDFVAGFAFRVGYLDYVSRRLNKEELIKKTQDLIRQYITNRKAQNSEELTFEYNHPGFLKVDNPDWWIKSK